MKRFGTLTALLVLAACAQVPVPGDQAQLGLAPAKLSSAKFDLANGLAKHSTGVYVVGQTDGNLYGTNKGSSDVFISKYRSNGTVLWGRQFGTPKVDYPNAVAGDGSNNAYVAGSTSGTLAGSRGAFDGFLRKYNSSGGVVWTRQFGSTADAAADGVATYGTNAVYVVGRTNGNLAGNKGGYDAYLRKYSARGKVVWTKQFGGPQDDYAIDVAIDSRGNVYVLGDGDNGTLIRKYNPSGSLVWTRQPFSDYGGKAMAISGNSIYVVGGFLNVGGSFEGNGQLSPYMPTDDNEYFHMDVWVEKHTTSGSFVWGKDYARVMKMTSLM